MEETTAINNQLSVVTLTSPQLPTLPFDVIPEILCRLPVKLLLQLRCVCKSWNSLISGSNFIKKHLHLSTTRHLHFLSYNHDSYKYILESYPLNSVFTKITTSFTQFEYSRNDSPDVYGYCNCNGILCIVDFSKGLVTLWNPYIRKFKELPPLYKEPTPLSHYTMTFGFGYDSFMDKYKVVVVNYTYHVDHTVDKIEVRVHTLGTNIWRSVKEHPFKGTIPIPDFGGSGKFVSGTINWLFIKALCWTFPFMVSFDLAKECFQKISPPSIEGVDVCDLSSLDVLRDCLCVTSGDDIWIMKEYGNKESWTKLFTIPYMGGPTNFRVCAKAVYLFEDDQLLLKFKGDCDLNLILYDSRSGTLKSTSFSKVPAVYIESLISPCSLC